MKILTSPLLTTMFLIASCAPAMTSVPTVSKTQVPTETIPPTETITPTSTSTHTPSPPTATFTPTPIPRVSSDYPETMQIAIFDPVSFGMGSPVKDHWPDIANTLATLVFDESRETSYRWSTDPESIIHILGPDEYTEVKGIGWSPNGNYFIYAASNTDGLGWCIDICEGIDIWIVSKDGSYKQLLSSEIRLSPYQISWHPSETKLIAFCPQDPDKYGYNREICIVHIPSGEIERTENMGIYARYSPLGNSYIFSNDKFEQFIVYENEITPLSIGSFERAFWVFESATFAWSPDGNYIYIIGQRTLQRVALDGTNELLTVLQHTDYIIENTSPNGLYILMCRRFDSTRWDDCMVYDTTSRRSIALSSDGQPKYWHPDNTLQAGYYIFDFKKDTRMEKKHLAWHNNLGLPFYSIFIPNPLQDQNND